MQGVYILFRFQSLQLILAWGLKRQVFYDNRAQTWFCRPTESATKDNINIRQPNISHHKGKMFIEVFENNV